MYYGFDMATISGAYKLRPYVMMWQDGYCSYWLPFFEFSSSSVAVRAQA